MANPISVDSLLSPDVNPDILRQLVEAGYGSPQTSIQSSHPVAAICLLATRVQLAGTRAIITVSKGYGFLVSFDTPAYAMFATVNGKLTKSDTVYCEPIPRELVAVLMSLAKEN